MIQIAALRSRLENCQLTCGRSWVRPSRNWRSLPGTVRCTTDIVEEALFDRRRDLFTEVELVFFDTTSLYFEGQGGEIGQRGHNKDHRPDLKQMVVGMTFDAGSRTAAMSFAGSQSRSQSIMMTTPVCSLSASTVRSAARST
jgi:hypothetical protein